MTNDEIAKKIPEFYTPTEVNGTLYVKCFSIEKTLKHFPKKAVGRLFKFETIDDSEGLCPTWVLCGCYQEVI